MNSLTEALSKTRIKTNFASFLKEFEPEDLMEIIIEVILKNINKIAESISKIDLMPEQIEVVKNTLSKKEGLLNEFPNIYMEKILSELRNEYKNYKSKEMFIEEIPENEIISTYSSLIFFRTFINKNGLTDLKNILNQYESKAYSKNYNIANEIIRVISGELARKAEKETKRMSNRRLFKNENIEVYKIDDSRDACITLGKGTNWCVANTHDDGNYRRYSSEGDMYAFIFMKVKSDYNPEYP
ncbi:MAG: hypothetical protein SNJ71_08290, partial [Bacteroidales bacterium]